MGNYRHAVDSTNTEKPILKTEISVTSDKLNRHQLQANYVEILTNSICI